MWEHHSDKKHGWKYSVTSKQFIIQITGGSISIWDRQTQALLKRHKGHHYLYTGDISPDETQCFALENGKHFYVYSLENYELIQRVTLPRGYECIDMYGHYSGDGKYICIPAHKWIGTEATSEGYYAYVMCRYDARTLALAEKVTIGDPEPYWWEIDETPVAVDDEDIALIQKIGGIIEENAGNRNFPDCLTGYKPKEGGPAAAKLWNLLLEERKIE